MVRTGAATLRLDFIAQLCHEPLWSPPRAMTILVRTRIDDPSAILSSVRRVLADVDPNVPLANARTMEELALRPHKP